MSVRDVSIDLRLLKSARDEFLKQGFIKAELKTICENAGVTTGAVYKRYKGKEELFCAVVQETVDTLKAYVENNTAPSLKDMSDDEMRYVWSMREDSMLGLFRILWKVKRTRFPGKQYVVYMRVISCRNYHYIRAESVSHTLSTV